MSVLVWCGGEDEVGVHCVDGGVRVCGDSGEWWGGGLAVGGIHMLKLKLLTH